MYVGCTVNENENVGLQTFCTIHSEEKLWLFGHWVFVHLIFNFVGNNHVKIFRFYWNKRMHNSFFPVQEIDSTHGWIGISHMSVFVRLLAIIYTCHYIQIHPKTRRINNIKFSNVIYGFVVATQKSKQRTLITADKIYLSHHSEQKRKQTSNNRKWPEVYKSQALKSFGGIVACV